jgi:adenylate cyclase
MLVFFGAPFASHDDPERAVACAIHMQNALLDINTEQRANNLPQLGMGIGIHTGDVVVGNIGCEKRASYGAVGSPINTAFRIESYTVGGQILISPVTYEKIPSLVRVRDQIHVTFKGLEGGMTLYDVEGITGSHGLSLVQAPVPPLATLVSPIPVVCYPIRGKAVSKEALSGEMTRLSRTQAEILLYGHLDAHANVTLDLDSHGGGASSHIYAKAVFVEPLESDREKLRVLIEFTFLPEDSKDFVERMLDQGKEELEG